LSITAYICLSVYALANIKNIIDKVKYESPLFVCPSYFEANICHSKTDMDKQIENPAYRII